MHILGLLLVCCYTDSSWILLDHHSTHTGWYYIEQPFSANGSWPSRRPQSTVLSQILKSLLYLYHITMISICYIYSPECKSHLTLFVFILAYMFGKAVLGNRYRASVQWSFWMFDADCSHTRAALSCSNQCYSYIHCVFLVVNWILYINSVKHAAV